MAGGKNEGDGSGGSGSAESGRSGGGGGGGWGGRGYRRAPSPAPSGLDDFDEAYETSEFEEDDGASIVDGADKAKAKLATADDDIVRKLENCFKKLTWARGSSSLLKRFLTKKVFDRLKYRVTTTSGGGATLYDVIAAGVENLDTPIGVFAPDPNTYRTFWPLLKPLISTWHRVQNSRSLIQPSVNWGDLGRFDTSGGFDRKYVRSYQFRIARQGWILIAEHFDIQCSIIHKRITYHWYS